jgi:hypothetical protein
LAGSAPVLVFLAGFAGLAAVTDGRIATVTIGVIMALMSLVSFLGGLGAMYVISRGLRRPPAEASERPGGLVATAIDDLAADLRVLSGGETPADGKGTSLVPRGTDSVAIRAEEMSKRATLVAQFARRESECCF